MLSEALRDARDLYRQGDLEGAAAAFDQLIAETPEDAELLTLRGLVALEAGDRQGAAGLLERALDLVAPDAVRIAALEARLRLAKGAGAPDEVAGLIERFRPVDPVAPPADPASFAAYLALAGLALEHGDAALAAALVDACLAREGDASTEHRLRLAALLAGLGRADALVALAARVAAENADDARQMWLDAWSAAHQNNQPDLALQARRTLVADYPTHRDRREELASDALRVLVLRGPLPGVRPPGPDALYGGNTITAFCAYGETNGLAFDAYALPGGEGALTVPPPGDADLVFNNMASAEHALTTGAHQQAVCFTKGLEIPVLNRPELVAKTSRLGLSDLLVGIDGVRVPKTMLGRNDGVDIRLLARRIARQIGLPVIIRTVSDHRGLNMTLCGTVEAVERALARLVGRRFYAIEYAETRVTTDLWRKFRVVFIDGQIIGQRLDFGRSWNVHDASWLKIAKGLPKLMKDEMRYIGGIADYLGTSIMKTMQVIRDRVGLEYFGMDYSFDRQGRLVVFELNPAMRAIPGDAQMQATELEYSAESRRAIREAFGAMLLRYARKGRAGRVARGEVTHRVTAPQGQ
ncbi:MAG: hypothetical protein AAF577_00295 [Pseudomonadota bacterium]